MSLRSDEPFEKLPRDPTEARWRGYPWACVGLFKGLRWLYLCWRGPRQFNDEQAGWQRIDAEGFGRWWAQQVTELVDHGIRLEFIERMNEPDSGGGWSTGMSPPIYSAAVKATRRELDARGFQGVGIVAPGLTYLDWETHNSKWIAALDDEALAVWSSHMWDDGDPCHGGASCVDDPRHVRLGRNRVDSDRGSVNR